MTLEGRPAAYSCYGSGSGVGTIAALTVKLTLKLRVVNFLPLTLTVAVYVPGASPVFGLTVKLLLPFTPMLLSDVFDKVNLLALVPDSDTVIAPVA